MSLAKWGRDEARQLLEERGYSVSDYPQVNRSNALLVEAELLIPGKTVEFVAWPKSSNTYGQVRLSEAIARATSDTEIYVFAFVPKISGVPVNDEYSLFIVPAGIAIDDARFAADVYAGRGRRGSGFMIKHANRQPHQRIWQKWERCFLEGWDWLPGGWTDEDHRSISV